MSLPASVRYTDVDIATVWAAGDERTGNYASVILPFPRRTYTEPPEGVTVSDVKIIYAVLLYLDGSPAHHYDSSDVEFSAEFVGAGVRLYATIPQSSLPSDYVDRSYLLHFLVEVTIS